METFEWVGHAAQVAVGHPVGWSATLPARDSQDYELVKKAILHRYDVNQETHRVRFCQDRKKSEESYREWICWITDHFDKWVKESAMTVHELVIT